MKYQPLSHNRIGARQAEVLAAVGQAGRPLTVAEVRSEVGRPGEHRNTLAYCLDRLRERGFVNRNPAPAEGVNNYRYSITSGGAEALAKYREANPPAIIA